jgi:aspartyl-tRNA synthetase
MSIYRSHTCGDLRASDSGQIVRLSGWVHRKHDLGSILFLQLRDHYGITQVVIPATAPFSDAARRIASESVVQISGPVGRRDAANVNANLVTGEIEVVAESFEVLSEAEPLPFQIADETNVSDVVRLKYRFLDLRRQHLHRNIQLRCDVISRIRQIMIESGFREFQTPILTSSSPEGARDYLVASRVHPGKFYALPQAPQQFKQLLMIAGFDRYFQIAPCFRDENARSDRSPGEFYQLDMEMSFVTQEDVFAVIESVMHRVFTEFSTKRVSAIPFERRTYHEAMEKYGTDKPDLRNPLIIGDLTAAFETTAFPPFRATFDAGGTIRAIAVPQAGTKGGSFFRDVESFVKEQGGAGVAWLAFTDGQPRGPLAKHYSESVAAAVKQLTGFAPDAAVLFVAGPAADTVTLAGRLRTELARRLSLLDENEYRFCWIVDFPMYERDAETGAIGFSHNPFSMPQGGLEALETLDPLDVRAYQYDIVCNGIELSSGAIRNHRADIMHKAFEIAGYDAAALDEKFGGMLRALRFGAPPHGGIAPGIDRIVMLLSGEDAIRDVIAFPMTNRAEDLMMGAPSEVSEQQLRELHIRIDPPVVS